MDHPLQIPGLAHPPITVRLRPCRRPVMLQNGLELPKEEDQYVAVDAANLPLKVGVKLGRMLAPFATHEGVDIPLTAPLPTYQYVLAGLPLAVLLLGGGLGAGLAVGSYMGNLMIYRSGLSLPLKIVCSCLVGGAAVLFYLLIVVILTLIFPGMFRR